NLSNLYDFLCDAERWCSNVNIETIAYTLQVGRDAMKCRAAFVVRDIPELIQKLVSSLADKNNTSLNESKDANRDELVQKEVVESCLLERDWDKLAGYWVLGNKVPWEALYRDLKLKKVVLPSYSFEDERYWPKLSDALVVKEKYDKSIGAKDNVFVSEEAEGNDLLGKIQHDLIHLIHQVLHVPLDRIEVDTRLTEFGFDSINLVKYARVVSSHFNVTMTPAKLFAHITVASAARYLQAEFSDEINKFYDTHFQHTATEVKYQPLPAVKHEKNLNIEREPIAIVGISGRFPESDNLDMYWENLLAGKNCISEVPAARWDWKDYYSDTPENKNKTDIIWGGFIDDVQKFDAAFFGLATEETEALDPQQRLLLKYTYKAIEDAGYNPMTFSNQSVGVFMGISNNGYDGLVESSGKLIDWNFITGALSSVGPNRISYFFDFQGPSEPVETACASSLVAIDRAISEINSGVCDTAIVGGVNVIVTPYGHIAFNKASLLSKAGCCKPFSAQADGFVRSEGVGVLVLKRLSLAEKDNDQIHAVILGSGVNHNGKGNFLTAPNPIAQADLLESVYKTAGVDINTVNYIEAHGTGTELGDGIEIEGLKSAFTNLGYQNKPAATCAVGSVKSNIGHTEIASGMASILKVLYQMKTKTLASQINCDTFNPDLQLEGSPFYIVSKNQEWGALEDPTGSQLPRRAGVSAFGLSGVNAHVIIEEYIDKRTKDDIKNSEEIIVLSAKNKVQLESTATVLHGFLSNNKEISLSDIAYTLQQGREPMQARLAIVTKSIQDLLNTLDSFVEQADSTSVKVKYFDNISEKYSKVKAPSLDSIDKHSVQELARNDDLEKFAMCWVSGKQVNWNLLSEGKVVRRVSLPGYQFCEQDYWVTK
ncbi:MAG: beta-ketoacyl synthase N-terminal-like domain-containing protein, partial [Candidatus Thioglobus sp.]